MILVILIPIALIAMMIGSLANYEQNLETLRFWRLLHSGLCVAIAGFSLTTETPLPPYSIGLAASMVLILLSDIAARPAQKGSLYRGAMLVLTFTAVMVQPDLLEYLPAVLFGGLFSAALLVSALSSRTTTPAAAQAVGIASFTFPAAALLALLPHLVGASGPLIVVGALLLVVHGIERVYFPTGFYRGMRTGELTAMGAHLMIVVTAGMIGIEGGWIG
ncbi:hypothetical protein [Spirochaeta africana]|uniref:Uncharacterized protein n=1 Tax=Spirochaeta africana (strain ATCC 700263 / DSM 8902 / Z-7692) TaxID=889378 RepID=H9UGZ8_SPIAZ|nr:hypothetical protein [Spirochaeta africana]AFG36791.1 hypothetical protein Spiaf_0691 [Spirochaeta africana DSM 8902]